MAIGLSLASAGRWARWRILRAAGRPRAHQKSALRRILRTCAHTDFGRTHGFAAIKGIDDFRRSVPIQDYEQIRPLLDRQIATGVHALAPETPVFYARTSGTTGQPKLIPVTSAVLRGLKRAQLAMAFEQQARGAAFSGRILGIGGPLREASLANGAIAGSVSGLIYKTMPASLRAKYVLPPEVFEIADYNLRYALIARLAVAEGNVSTIATANPSTILRLVEQIRHDLPHILHEIATGECSLIARLDTDAKKAVQAVIAADSSRAIYLRALLDRNTAICLADLWPRLRCIVTWLGGGCAVAAQAVARLSPDEARMIDFGYVASEMRATIVIDAARDLAVPLLDDVFFEFVSAFDWEQGIRDTILVDEIDSGVDYHVIVTTFSGLIRYHMNDVLRAGARIGNTPTLKFIRKGRGVTSITGEKLSEDQVISAISSVSQCLGELVAFYAVLADASAAAYLGFVEFASGAADCSRFARQLDDKLCSSNIEYQAKRASGRLGPIEIVPLKAGTGELYRRHCVARGQREAQLKLPCLQRAEDCDFEFRAHRSPDAHLSTELS